MRIQIHNDLLPINILSILLILIITFFPSNVLRTILSLPFILFFPGYTAIAFLFPKKNHLSNIERVTLSIALSLVVVTLVGLGLSCTPWGICIYPVLVTIFIFIVVTSVIAWYRRYRFGVEN